MYSKLEVEQAVDKMASKVEIDLENKKPIMLCVVTGGIYLMGQIMAKTRLPLEINYVHVSRYQKNLEGQQIEWLAKPDPKIIEGRNIAIVDDVLDQGITIKSVIDWCVENGANSVYSIVLIDKVNCRSVEGLQKADCVGLEAKDDYLFGCGLDVKGFFRNLPEIYSVPKHIIPEIDKHL